jgi:hypothetical protein
MATKAKPDLKLDAKTARPPLGAPRPATKAPKVQAQSKVEIAERPARKADAPVTPSAQRAEFVDMLCDMGEVQITIRMLPCGDFAQKLMRVDIARAGHSTSRDFPINDETAAALIGFAESADQDLPR